ncbi:MAG: tetratricopeptide repeat protein [Bryobacteraceae bacterium]
MLPLVLQGAVEAGDPVRLLPLYEIHLREVAEKTGPASLRMAEALVEAGRFAESTSRPEMARGYFERALAIAGSESGDPLLVADVLSRLAEVSPSRERLGLLDRAIEIRKKQSRPSRELVSLYRKTGELAAARGDGGDAMARYRAAADLAAKVLVANDPELAAAWVDLGFAMEQRDQFRQAAVLYRRALAVQEKALGPTHPETAITLNNLAGVTGAQGNLVEAEKLLRRALGILEGNLGPWHARVAVCLGNLGDLLAATGRAAPARGMYARAIAIYERLGDERAAAEIRASALELRK